MPDERARRKELLAQYKQAAPDAGVFRIVNRHTNRALLGSSLNLASVANKVEFARHSGSPGALDHRLRKDFEQYGADAFVVEILDRLEITPDMTDAQIREDLSALEQLWRERAGPALWY